jgi:hypothetical protein
MNSIIDFQMKHLNIDKLNIGLILLSFVLAILLPFELFLFSYAVLGPLHYLTEINWLQKQNYFTSSKLVVGTLIGICLLITIIYFVTSMGLLSQITSHHLTRKYANTIITYLTLIAFIFVIISEFVKEQKYLWLGFLVASTLSVVVLQMFYHAHVFSFIFLPTLVHVFLFTMFFVWVGFLKSKNTMSLINLILLLIIPMVIFLWPNSFFQAYSPTSAFNVYSSTSFIKLNGFFNIEGLPNDLFYTSVVGLKTQIFISFAYTYHYLNWFSKTNLIGWAKAISKVNLSIIGFLWVGAISLYAYNYRLGLMVLFMMSLAHVFLEFPLNIKSIRIIYKHYHQRIMLKKGV